MALVLRLVSFSDPDEAVDSNGCLEEGSISVLLTWSRNFKCDNSFIQNGEKKIRAPIWRPEFPIKDKSCNKRTQRANSYSLGQIFVADSCEEPPNKILRLENLPLIDDRYVFSLGAQRQETGCIQTASLETGIEHYGSRVTVEKLHAPRYANYLQPLPEVSSPNDRLYQYYDASAIQSMAIHAQDVPWYSYRHSPQASDTELNSNKRVTVMERAGHDPCVRQDRFYHAEFSGDEYPQVVFQPQQFYQTCKIQGRDITAL